MKKFLFASVLGMAALCYAAAPALLAQEITIKDPAEYNAYQLANNQTDPAAKAAAFESFLSAYPQSVVKADVLDTLIDTYQAQRDMDKTLGATTRLLQVEPNNWKAISFSVYLKKQQCAKTQDAQVCDDAAVLARKGLLAPKPKGLVDEEWKKQTGVMYPLYHSTLALDLIVAKKDFKGAVEEYRQELMLFPVEGTKSGPGLSDTLQLAQAYTKLTPPDMPNAVWFFARAYAFAPDSYKPQILKQAQYWYKKFHGGDDGFDAIKAQAAENLFPAGGAPVIKPAKTAAEIAHDVVSTTADLKTLNLGDDEFILANGSKEDAGKLWAVLKDQLTPVPGIVLEATASVIKLAVSDDAKAAKTADFIVNLKTPLAEKEIPAAGFEFKLPPAKALVGAYDSFQQVAATDASVATAQIVLRDGEIRAEEKKAAAAPRKPAAGHK
jgi:tetratricopeptide (TPR) repeat protein